MIGISSPQNHLRQNRSLLLVIGGLSSLLGLFLWSAPPFIWSNPKDKLGVCLRYLSLFGALGCGVSAIVAGKQLERITPLLKAIETAEKNDFLDQLASSQFLQQQQWHQIAATQLQAFQQNNSEPVSQPVAEANTDELTTSPSAEVLPIENFRSLYKSVSALKQQGVSDTQIIEEILGMGGRRFNDGKKALETLLQLGQQQQW